MQKLDVHSKSLVNRVGKPVKLLAPQPDGNFLFKSVNGERLLLVDAYGRSVSTSQLIIYDARYPKPKDFDSIVDYDIGERVVYFNPQSRPMEIGFADVIRPGKKGTLIIRLEACGTERQAMRMHLSKTVVPFYAWIKPAVEFFSVALRNQGQGPSRGEQHAGA